MIDVAAWLPAILALAFGYLLGSIPFGLILTSSAGLGDIRNLGSGNIGATNVLRTGNKGLAAATLALDLLKGTLAVLIADHLMGREAALLAGLGAFLGHVFPVWLNFNGGKGVATYLGVLLGLFWPAALFTAFVWLATAALTRYSSLAALVASAAAPVLLFSLGLVASALVFAVMTAILWLKHAGNIRRLLAGTESRIDAESAGNKPGL